VRFRALQCAEPPQTCAACRLLLYCCVVLGGGALVAPPCRWMWPLPRMKCGGCCCPLLRCSDWQSSLVSSSSGGRKGVAPGVAAAGGVIDGSSAGQDLPSSGALRL